jgi:hypothetical protein
MHRGTIRSPRRDVRKLRGLGNSVLRRILLRHFSFCRHRGEVAAVRFVVHFFAGVAAREDRARAAGTTGGAALALAIGDGGIVVVGALAAAATGGQWHAAEHQ